jgi:DNA-binding HxlR family transcriptional regulator
VPKIEACPRPFAGSILDDAAELATVRGSSSRDTILVEMRTMKAIHDETCSVAACAEIIGAKWTAILVHDLSEGPRRFSELEHSCAGISPRTLSERLRALEDDGVVERHSYPESPPRVEYRLTAKGEALLPIIAEMRRFGHAWLVDDEPATV